MFGWYLFDWTPSGVSGRNFGLKFWNGFWLGISEELLVGKCESEALRGAGEDLIRGSER